MSASAALAIICQMMNDTRHRIQCSCYNLYIFNNINTEEMMPLLADLRSGFQKRLVKLNTTFTLDVAEDIKRIHTSVAFL